mgnify:CR=1 FL=1
MSAEPSFVLSGPAGTMLGDGIATGYRDVSAAAAALRDGSARIILGALPFDVSRPAALYEPRSVRWVATLPDWPSDMPPGQIRRMLPGADAHRERVAAAIARLRDPASGLHKVVLARALEATAETPWRPTSVLRRLADADPSASVYLADLSPAGPEYAGVVLLGASPELLVDRAGDRVRCAPFAGSAPRSAEPAVDAANGAALAASGKNRHEHQLVIDTMRDALEPLCVDLQIAPEPQLHRTDALWHLGTPIAGRLRDTSTTALDLALALHPTPAVGGVPTAAATALIAEVEGDRGFYAGAVGWCDDRGDGRWVVSIRGAQLSADRRSALAHCGGGIVAESDPADELDETTTKFRTILSGLGVDT